MATVLLILVSLATGLVIYSFMTGWIGSKLSGSGGPGAVLVIEAGYYNGTHFILYVRNDGAGTANITRAYIIAPNGTVYMARANNVTDPSGRNVLIQPGDVGTVVIGSVSGIIINGFSYRIRIVSNDGSEVSAIIST